MDQQLKMVCESKKASLVSSKTFTSYEWKVEKAKANAQNFIYENSSTSNNLTFHPLQVYHDNVSSLLGMSGTLSPEWRHQS